MSAESTVAFYGVRFEIADEDITSLEERSHPLLVKARQNGLKTYWGNFAEKGRKCLLFVGDKVGIFGLENDRQVRVSVDELANRANDTNARLQRAGIVEQAMLYLEWQPDIR
ncbi:MAG TPA: hypothetical protein VMY42_00445 [Thermoguttaceae bacterium]|nr:hypothetical protein [Thermoguttaceae bacterium]